MEHVLSNEELKLLPTDALHRLAAFLMELRNAMDELEAVNKDTEEELDMALACLKEQALWETDRRRG